MKKKQTAVAAIATAIPNRYGIVIPVLQKHLPNLKIYCI
jgi:hypothetical protein